MDADEFGANADLDGPADDGDLRLAASEGLADPVQPVRGRDPSGHGETNSVGHTCWRRSSNPREAQLINEETTMTTVETASSPEHLMRIFADRAAGGDAAGLLALYEPDAVFEPQRGVVLRGHDEIGATLEGLAAMKPRI
jgi:hypothetical protein